MNLKRLTERQARALILETVSSDQFILWAGVWFARLIKLLRRLHLGFAVEWLRNLVYS
ncbi:MAG: hypothetical protein GWN58_20315 [Anaerolineae bacterium]|nr:hypothetical protein [Anaerolineae bacterium]